MTSTLYDDGMLEPLVETDSMARRIGIAKGELIVPGDFDKYNDEIADMFEEN